MPAFGTAWTGKRSSQQHRASCDNPAARDPIVPSAMTNHDPTPSPAAIVHSALPAAVACLALYLAAAALLLWRLPGDPPYPHNWEAYTAWRVGAYWGDVPDLAGALAPTDGLMTDSGRGPLVGIPVWLGFSLGRVGPGALRIPVALVSAAALPLLWLVARRLVPTPVAGLAAALLALSPVWLHYARTATIVAPSLVPLLLATWAALLVVEPPGEPTGPAPRWPVAVLCGALAAGLYAYAPARLIWPMAVAIVLLAAWRQPARRRELAVAALAALVSVPLAVAAAEVVSSPNPHPVRAIVGYFDARGEQVLAMDPADYARYLPSDAVPGDAAPGPAALVRANARDLLRLLADDGTLPVRSEYWSPRGRLWPAAFGALSAIGAGWATWRALRWHDWRAGALLAVSAGLALPLLLTTRVHVGRIVPALPFLLVFVAWGGWLLVEAVCRLPNRFGGAPLRLAVRVAVLAGLVGGAAGAAAAEWATPPAMPREVREAEALAMLAPEAGPAGLIAALDPALGQEIVDVRAAAYRLILDDVYRVSVLPAPPADRSTGSSADPGSALPDPRQVPAHPAVRPPLRVGNALGYLERASLPAACAATWAVQPEIETALRDALAAACPASPPIIVLPR